MEKFPKEEQSDESLGYKKQSRKETAAKGKKTTYLEVKTVKKEQQHESSSDATKKFPEGEETGHFLKEIKESKSDITDAEKKGKRIKESYQKTRKIYVIVLRSCQGKEIVATLQKIKRVRLDCLVEKRKNAFFLERAQRRAQHAYLLILKIIF